MITPLAAIAANVGTRALNRLLDAAASTSTPATSRVTADFSALMTSSTDASFNALTQKLLAENPSLSSTLGSGPLTLTYNEGKLTLKNSAGVTVEVPITSPTAQKTLQLAQSLGLKKFEKMLES